MEGLSGIYNEKLRGAVTVFLEREISGYDPVLFCSKFLLILSL
jgi:hypothetical protein